VLVGLFNPLFDQTLLLEVAGYPVAGGWVSLLSILVRFALTMSASLVLVGSTGFFQMGAGLARLGVPRVFTTQLLFMHRYALVLAGEAGRMNLARELRGGPARAMPLAVYGSLLGHLLLRAMDRSERIYQAMRLRGFRGNLHSPRPLQWRTRDSFLLATSWAVFALARQFDLAHLLGRVLVGSVR
jgi:cobalt/nickel transport system permease protein